MGTASFPIVAGRRVLVPNHNMERRAGTAKGQFNFGRTQDWYGRLGIAVAASHRAGRSRG